jgi:hypothetical protein
MASKGRFPAGTKLEFAFAKTNENETLLLFRCGEPCNTAKLVRKWRLNVFPPTADVVAILDQEGRYYFWIQRRLTSGEVGTVTVAVSTPGSDTVKVRYTSGTELTVTRVAPKSR